MTCNNCVLSIKKTINQLSNVRVIDIDLKSGRVELDCQSGNISQLQQPLAIVSTVEVTEVRHKICLYAVGLEPDNPVLLLEWS